MKAKVIWSGTVWTITCMTLALVAIACAMVISVGVEAMSIVFLAVVAIAIIYCLCMSPRSIEVTDTELILKMWIGRRRFALNHVVAAEDCAPNGSDLRLIGSGGVFGFLGRFTNDTIGTYTAYVGDYRGAFVLKMDDGKAYMMSCRNRDAMVEYINELIIKK